VEDEENLQDALKLNFEMEGYEVTSAYDGAEALKALNNEYFDLIILDVLLSGSDGRYICKNVKTNIKTKHIPIIMVSAHPGVDNTALQAGADAFLAKPFQINDLRQAINRFIN